MTKEIVKYISFAVEEYKKKKNMNGYDVSKFFKENNIYKFIEDCYEALHTQSVENLILDIDEYANLNYKGKL